MKALSLVLKVKRRELKEEEAILRNMLNDLRDLESKLSALEGELAQLKSLSCGRIADFAVVSNYSLFLLRKIEELRLRKDLLEQGIEEQKRRLAYKRGEVKVIENYIKKKFVEKEKRDELLLERFVSEVRRSSSAV